MFHILLYQPEIPPNTGNILRLCANTGCHLHLIEPLGFTLEDKQLKRAGLDYIDRNIMKLYPDLDSCLTQNLFRKVYALSTKGKNLYSQPAFELEDAFLFGPETRGLPASVLEALPPRDILRMPMKESSRSLNLSNVVSIQIYEAWRQVNFMGANPGL